MSITVRFPSLFARWTRRPRSRDRLLPLYGAVVAVGRAPVWYREGEVPDTLDGRFDMIAAVIALVLVRLEAEPGDAAKQASVLLTELFIADMDESLRQIGIGDYVVGKQVGRMVGALGGRLAAFREASRTGAFEDAVRRNVFHEAAPSEAAVTLVAGTLQAFAAALAATPASALIAGSVPTA